MNIPEFPEFKHITVEYVELQVPLIPGYTHVATAAYREPGNEKADGVSVYGDDIAECWTHLINQLRAKDLAIGGRKRFSIPIVNLDDQEIDAPIEVQDDDEIPF